MTDAEWLAKLWADPHDAALRSVYADWLEQRGDPRGEFLRLETQARAIGARLFELRAGLDPTWLAAVRPRCPVRTAPFVPADFEAVEVDAEWGYGLAAMYTLADGMCVWAAGNVREQARIRNLRVSVVGRAAPDVECIELLNEAVGLLDRLEAAATEMLDAAAIDGDAWQLHSIHIGLDVLGRPLLDLGFSNCDDRYSDWSVQFSTRPNGTVGRWHKSSFTRRQY